MHPITCMTSWLRGGVAGPSNHVYDQLNPNPTLFTLLLASRKSLCHENSRFLTSLNFNGSIWFAKKHLGEMKHDWTKQKLSVKTKQTNLGTAIHSRSTEKCFLWPVWQVKPLDSSQCVRLAQKCVMFTPNTNAVQ